VLFLQYWYWFPLLYSLSLSIHPNSLVGLTGDLKIPTGVIPSQVSTTSTGVLGSPLPTPSQPASAEASTSVPPAVVKPPSVPVSVVSESAFAPLCVSPPAWFQYTPATEEKKEDKREKMAVVELTHAKSGNGKKVGKQVEEKLTPGEEEKVIVDTNSTTPAPKEFRLANPCRVTPSQAKFVHLSQVPHNVGQRFSTLPGVCFPPLYAHNSPLFRTYIHIFNLSPPARSSKFLVSPHWCVWVPPSGH